MAITGFDLNSFKTNFKGGARSYLFIYQPNLPEDNQEAKYLVKSTTLPETTVEEIIVNWQGADFKMAGKQTFADWTITFNGDKLYKLRKQFETWMKSIMDVDNEIKYGEPTDYFSDQTLQLLDYDGSEIDSLTLYDAWPKTVGAVTLDYSSQEVAQFDVTFTYQYHKFTGNNG